MIDTHKNASAATEAALQKTHAANSISTSTAAQRHLILKWLQSHQRITTLQARNELGIMHPAGRIRELKSAGHNIVTHLQLGIDVTGKRHKQALYVLLPGNGWPHE